MLEAAGPEALELGLLMTEEQDVTIEDDEELYSFQHKLIHEFVAAQYIASKMTNTDFLMENFVTSRDIENHIEVVCFCIDMANSNAKEVQCLVKYLTGKYAQKAGRLVDLGELGINEIYEWQGALVPMVQAFSGSQEQKEMQFIKATSIYIHIPLFSPEYLLYIRQNQKGEEEENVLIVENHGSKSEDPFWLGYLKKIYPKLLGGLHRLDLSRCEISKLSIKSLMPDLSLMSLKSCNFAGSLLRTGLDLITEAISTGSLKTVECCDFSECEIPASTLINFISEINLCPNIRVVNLNGNAFTDIELELDVTCCPTSIESRSIYSKGTEVSAQSDNTSRTTSQPHRLQKVLLQRIANSEHILLYSDETDAEDLAAVVKHCKSIILNNIKRHKMDNTDEYQYFDRQIHNAKCVRHITYAIARYDLMATKKIDFSHTNFSPDELKSFFSVLHECNHQKDLILIGSNPHMDITVALPESLGIANLFPGLNILDISGKDISNMLHLLTAHIQTSLVKLNISQCNLTRADIEALVVAIEAGRFPKLQEIDVEGYDLSQSLHLVHLLPGLEKLDVSRKYISNSLHLLTEHVQTSLVKLNISQCNLTRADIEALLIAIEAGRFPKLQEIQAGGYDTIKRFLPQSLQIVHLLPGLEELDISGKDISNSLHLVTEHVQTSLLNLNVSRCNLTRADIEALATAIKAGQFPKLQQVEVMGNDLSQSLHFVRVLPGFTERLNSHSIEQYLPQSLCLVHLLSGLEELDVSGKDISNSLHLLTEHVQDSLVKLDVSHCKLTAADIEALAAAIQAGRFPKLIQVDILGNDLSQSLHLDHLLPGLEELDVSGKDISNSLHLLTEHVQTSLVKLNVSRCNLTRADIGALAEAIQAGRFPKLMQVYIMGNDLSQSLYLVHVLPGFTESLNLHSIKQYLPESLSLVHLLPRLEELDVSGKDISNSLHLLTEHVQDSLVKLNVSHCNLTAADIESLVTAIVAGRFPKLQNVNVIGIDLSQSLHLVHLFPGLKELDISGKDISSSLHLLTEHAQTSLVKLNVCWCNLTKADIEAMSAAIEARRFPKLQDVYVVGNDLSQSLHLVHQIIGLKELDIRGKDIGNSLHLLTDHVQTSLVSLMMRWCSLVAADISALAAALTAGRLPCLEHIFLQGNSLDDDSVQPLCEALLQYEGPDQSVHGISYGILSLTVWLLGNNLSAEFVKQWKEKLKLKRNVQMFW